jgi:hypothetical protein
MLAEQSQLDSVGKEGSKQLSSSAIKVEIYTTGYQD